MNKNVSNTCWAASINHVDKRGGGVPEKTMFVHIGGGRVRGLSTWTKTFCGDPFLHMNSKKAARISKKKLYT